MKNYKITKAYYVGYGANIRKIRGTTQSIIIKASNESEALKLAEEQGFVETGGLWSGYIVSARRTYKS
jgi:hypothetical protein